MAQLVYNGSSKIRSIPCPLPVKNRPARIEPLYSFIVRIEGRTPVGPFVASYTFETQNALAGTIAQVVFNDRTIMVKDYWVLGPELPENKRLVVQSSDVGWKESIVLKLYCCTGNILPASRLRTDQVCCLTKMVVTVIPTPAIIL